MSGDALAEGIAALGLDVPAGTPQRLQVYLDLIEDEDVCRELSNDLEAEKVWIADGHHRYETACASTQSRR